MHSFADCFVRARVCVCVRLFSIFVFFFLCADDLVPSDADLSSNDEDRDRRKRKGTMYLHSVTISELSVVLPHNCYQD